jgi:RNA polymerase sigma factor (TIGR02999 family)
LPLVYSELRRMAHAHLGRERTGHTLSTTDLVHEVYVRLANQKIDMERSQFLRAAAASMRRILIDYARRHQAGKRGGGALTISLDETDVAAADESSDMLVALDEALTRLGQEDERLALVVECRYFGGLTEEETAEALEITARTVRRDWVKAKDRLYRELRDALE